MRTKLTVLVPVLAVVLAVSALAKDAKKSAPMATKKICVSECKKIKDAGFPACKTKTGANKSACKKEARAKHKMCEASCPAK